jgi:(p)ppGpp synthase/HD superfamily hydrolase
MLTPRFIDALIYAAQLHADQLRKGTSVPYIAHLFGVTALVFEGGGDEDEAIAALLHDAVEDQGGLKTLEEIRHLFGERVAAIVEACSDSFTIPKPPWQARKEAHIAHLRDASPEVLLVSLADKLHNARSILRDVREHGEQAWKKFKGGKEGTLWYYQACIDVLKENQTNYLLDELEQVVAEIQQIAEL